MKKTRPKQVVGIGFPKKKTLTRSLPLGRRQGLDKDHEPDKDLEKPPPRRVVGIGSPGPADEDINPGPPWSSCPASLQTFMPDK